MAMLSSKGPNCEDKVITRLMRIEKGGVVDFAQQANRNKNKFDIKKVRSRSQNKQEGQIKIYNPKDRLKAAQFIQGWWRDRCCPLPFFPAASLFFCLSEVWLSALHT